MDEKKREEIKEQAKKILTNFSEELGKVKLKASGGKKEVGGFREEKNPAKPDSDFRERMFSNAPLKEEDYIIAEKKEWQ